MADYTKEPWMNPSENVIADNGKMNGKKVSAVLLIGEDGLPYTAGSSGGGGVTGDITTNKGNSVSRNSFPVSNVSALVQTGDTSRISVNIFNNSNIPMYVGYGTSVSSSDFTFKLYGGDTLIIDDYLGDIHAISDSADAGQSYMVTQVVKTVTP